MRSICEVSYFRVDHRVLQASIVELLSRLGLHQKIKGARNYYFKTIDYCFRTKVKSPLVLRRLYATWPREKKKVDDDSND